MIEQNGKEAVAEFGITKIKFVINLLKNIRKIKKTRKLAEDYLENVEDLKNFNDLPDFNTIQQDLEKDTLDKIKTDKLVPIAQCISDIINSLMNLPKEEFLIGK